MVVKLLPSRNEESPFRALTHRLAIPALNCNVVSRNEESPFRALTHLTLVLLSLVSLCRNEESPFRALTHKCDAEIKSEFFYVEMKKARLGR